ncbi:hypothetical protein DV113_002306 [Geotrichum candidum]|uniref:Uncharacterized protein n=1 Tax=Geotrichum candidum TaxID=1173061 RepID=A0A0J9XAS4_GEOCN|nr:hypothetical protein DV452_003483 [Geotrichum candidum]KAI9213238.1 hypothetical protein DS838_001882 [Geotrichum bryndzae]KAF5119012.1 hypothetical protein DV454_000114 [Geotrichum candidum]KAF7499630.1 hypothetical protein DV113_002306 [Geotrichum candidum]KAI8132776.1 hypothetical protein DUD61_003572 [Geotrichum candidum]
MYQHRRPTLLPSQSHISKSSRRGTIAPSTLKSRQLAHLNAQLAQLQAGMSDLDNLLRVTAKQAEYIRKLGILHGSLFMAGHKVFEEEAMRAQEEEEEYYEQQQQQQQQQADFDEQQAQAQA